MNTLRSTFTRREFLGRTSLALGAAVLARRAAAADPNPARRVRIGINLCSLVQSAGKDWPATLKRLGELGYEGVEFTTRFGGFYKRTPKEIRAMLDDHGIRCCGWHPTSVELAADNLKATAAIAATLGAPNLIEASLAVHPGLVTSEDAWKRPRNASMK